MSRFKDTSKYDKSKRAVEVRDVAELPTDKHWLPVSIVAYQFRVSPQTIYNLFYSGQINGYVFPKGPILFSPEEVELVCDTY